VGVMVNKDSTEGFLYVVAGSCGALGSAITDTLLDKKDNIVLGIDSKPGSIFSRNTNYIHLEIDILGSNFPLNLGQYLRALLDRDAEDSLKTVFKSDYGVPPVMDKIPKRVRLCGIVNSLTGIDPKLSENVTIRQHPNLDEASHVGPIRDQMVRLAWSLYSADQFRFAVDVNLVAAHVLLTALYPFLEGSEKEISVVNVSSAFASKPPSQDVFESSKGFTFKPPGYSAAKAGLENYTAYCAEIFRDTNVSFKCIAPGVLDTGQSDEFRRNLKRFAPDLELLSVSQVNQVVQALLDESSRRRNKTVPQANAAKKV
jgi:NAD(P)-dependent dehydrogenase (short-subunit alcohol dehydrogenase family)